MFALRQAVPGESQGEVIEVSIVSRASDLAQMDGESSRETRLAETAGLADPFLARIDFRIVAAVAYALLIIAMWGQFAFSSGMPGETTFAFQSQTQSAWQGFWYVDRLRPHTNTFYHLSYLLGEVFGVTGSFVPYQFVYAALWWAKGFLLFLLLRRLFPGTIFLPYIVGALALVHASDLSLQWVGQLNQLGFTLWLLLSLYFFVVAVQQSNQIRAACYLVLACFFQYMCLWSYESPVFIILAAPLLIGFALRPRFKRLWTSSIGWYVVPIAYAFLSLKRYLHGTGSTYQESVLRKTWSLQALLSDLLFNLGASVSFWSWKRHTEYFSRTEVHRLATFATIVFVAGGVTLILYRKKHRAAVVKPDIDFDVAWRVLAAGSLLLILSFPAYLALSSPRTLWRTQLLSGIGAAMVMGAAFALAAKLLTRGWIRDLLVMSMSAVVVFYGASGAVERGAFFRWNWHRHQVAIQEVIRDAPQVRPETVIVLVGVPKGNDPLRHDMWFDMALRLAYPGVPVAGVFYYSDQTPGPGNLLKMTANRWIWSRTLTAPLVLDASLDQTIVLEYGADGNSRVLAKFPEFLCPDTCSPELYNPTQRIIGDTPSPVAIRRYGPL
jgi:hypothetical protein